jgi:hypothetical protein
VDTVTRPSSPRELRVSDTDRDRAVEELSEHFQAGRITQAEFGERSSRALAARTEGELAEPFADLPRRRAAVTPAGGQDDGPAGPLHVGLPRPVRFTVARVAVAALAVAALAGGLTGSPAGHRGLIFLLPVLVVLVVIRRLAGYRSPGQR